jgi:hypothetical protein
MARLHTLQDPFNNSSLTGSLWTQFTGGSATMGYSSSGGQTNFPATTSSSTDGDLSTPITYDLTNSYFLLNILAIPATGATTSSGIIRLQITSANFLSFRFQVGNIVAMKRVASADTDLFTAAWSSSTHAWVRIREVNGSIFWDTSSDGITWTNRWSEVTPIAITGLTVVLGGLSSGVDSSPGSFQWKFCNVPPSSNRPATYRYGSVGNGESRSEGWT